MIVQLTDKQLERQLTEWRLLEIRRCPPEIMDAEEAAAFLGWHIDTIYKMVSLGTIPVKKKGHSLKFLREDIRSWLKNIKEAR